MFPTEGMTSLCRSVSLQTVDDARQLMRHVDPELGQPLPEKSYGGNCRIYDKDKPDDPFHNFWVPMSDYNIYLILTFDI